MCGRYTLWAKQHDLREQFGFEFPALEPRFNIAPTQSVLAVRSIPEKARAAALLRWGLIPSWADDPAIGYKLINAKSETIASKPSFRSAFKRRRCLIVADGFYEWRKDGKKKQPFYFRVKGGKPFAFAGLWERWERDGDVIESCTMATTEANDVVRPVHERMPVILPPDDYDEWLDPVMYEPAKLLPLLRPYEGEMESYPVSSWVNAPAHQDEKCVEPIVAE